jgi:GNAT superfamily N-acetyltransferase
MISSSDFTPRIRPAQPADLPACVEVHHMSLGEMQRRHNFPPTPFDEMLTLYRHILETGIFHVTEVDGQIAGFACAILRGPWWFLSGFWVRPGMQGNGLGMPLLRSVWQSGEKAGAKSFFVWSSIDLPAMASYLKMGMLPGSQILTFEGSPLLAHEPLPAYQPEPLELSVARQIDEQILGAERNPDHDFWQRSGAAGYQLRAESRLIGYYYLNGGVIGPAAWLDPKDAPAVLQSAWRGASPQATSSRLRIPGMNHAALRFALSAGWRLVGYSHLLLTTPVGQMDRYLPSGPGLF